MKERKKCPVIVLCLIFAFSIFIIPFIVGIVLYIRNASIDKEYAKKQNGIKSDLENEILDLTHKRNRCQVDYDQICNTKENMLFQMRQQAKADAEKELEDKLQEARNTLERLGADIELKEMLLADKNAEYEKSCKTVENNANKVEKLKNIYKSFQYAIKAYEEGSDSHLDEALIDMADETLSPIIEMKLNCMNVKQLKKRYNDMQRSIQEEFKRYEGRYNTKANIAIKLFGDDLNKMFSLGNQIKGAISDIPGVADLNVEQQIERPQLKIQPKREMLAKFGITLPEFSEYVNVALAGKVISQVYEQGKSFDLIVKVKDDARDEIEKIRNLMVDTNDGRKVPLSYVAEVVSAMGPNTINRENVKRKIVISANVADRDLRSVVNDIQKRIDTSVQLPEGYHIEYGGQFESEQAASRTLALTSFISIVVIFLLLYNEFRSVKESGVILLNLPLALIGGVFALVITTGEVSIPAIIGFISLFGIATRNGMLLISHYNHLQKEEGLNVYDSVIRGSLDRLNPILMTALSSALALIPLALGGDLPGNEIQSPMAKVILGGLLTSTFLNGFIVPIVYLMMHRKKAQESL